MMMLWILCLLIGSITCTPIQKAYRSDSAAPAPLGHMLLPPYSGHWIGGVSSDPGRSSSLPSLPYPSSGKYPKLPAPQDASSRAGPGGYSNLNIAGGNEYNSGYNSPEVSEYGAAYSASGSSGYGSGAPGGNYYGYASSGSGYVGDASHGSVAAPRDEGWSSGSVTGYGDGNPEPVFSDVSDLEPVYSFNSRSSYQRARAVLAQTHYSPGEPAPPVIPASSPISKTSDQKSPAKAPTKGGF